MRHYEEAVSVSAPPKDLFQHVDDQTRLSSHMSGSSWMTGGGSMSISTDADRGQALGSHIRLDGKAFGIPVHLDEVVIERDPPYHKAWKTVGDLQLVVIGHYQMAFDIKEEGIGSRFTVSIDYELPPGISRALGYLFGDVYAKWCVRQMIRDARKHFSLLHHEP